jgi:hypothetical protein
VAAAGGWKEATTLLTSMASSTKLLSSRAAVAAETVAEKLAAGAETRKADPPKWCRTFKLSLLGSN